MTILALDPAVAGDGCIEVVRSAAGSVVTRAYATSPLRLLTPRSHGRAAWIYTTSYGGGLLGGDALRLAVRVGGGARAFVSSQASTKVYRSETGTTLVVQAHVGAGGHLILWPDPVVCYAGSHYVQRQDVELDAGAGLVLVDTMSSGRRGSGERWRFNRYAARLSVHYDSRIVLHDAIDLCPDDGELETRMGRFDVLGTAVVVGDPLRAHADRIVAEVAARSIERRADMLTAASPIGGGLGCVVRVAGRSAEQVGRAVQQHLSFVTGLLGDNPWARKW